MRIATRTLSTLFLGVLLVATAAAQANRPNIGAVQIVVTEIGTRAEIGTVEPGGSITLPAGSRVRLVMTALPTGYARGPLYPATTFSDTSAGAVTITRSNAENSTADLVINGGRNVRRTETIRYQISESWVPSHLRTGSFNIRVEPSSVGGAYRSSASSSIYGRSRADELTRVLYRAILMRDPDPGAAGTVESIDTGGYEALVRAAVGIANSDESQRLYDEGRSNEARLDSLYRNLLGISRSQVDSSQWRSDLLRIADGRIADVVNDIVRSDRFRDRFNL
ncbi:MAG TPA: hypothetical protein VGX68_00205 [Thermoanaerobaculia bacterium]|jgi:hypothetical protein|nr:hypothetical protein [Thermoanaerobaculia bacterium]